MFVKICGLRTHQAVVAAVSAGADALGFVFSPSPRRIDPAKARDLCDGLPPEVIRVAVMRQPLAEEWAEVRSVFQPDWLQTDNADFDALKLGGCEPLPVFRTGITSTETEWPPRILFERAHIGSGKNADWKEAARIAATTQMILAGGLDSDNLVSAIRTVKPWGVDVSSGVEFSRGIKALDKIRAFVARARATE